MSHHLSWAVEPTAQFPRLWGAWGPEPEPLAWSVTQTDAPDDR
jgi:hypothetical protein